jgi:hypothetical protein
MQRQPGASSLPPLSTIHHDGLLTLHPLRTHRDGPCPLSPALLSNFRPFLAVDHNSSRRRAPHPRTIRLQTQETEFTRFQLDNTHHWQVCRQHEPHPPKLQEAVEHGSLELRERVQPVSLALFSSPFFSIFSSFIVMASTNEYARKIFNSPTHAEPWLVASANEILQPDNWSVCPTFVGARILI